MVKALVGPVGWEAQVRRYVPEPVFVLLQQEYELNQTGSLTKSRPGQFPPEGFK